MYERSKNAGEQRSLAKLQLFPTAYNKQYWKIFTNHRYHLMPM